MNTTDKYAHWTAQIAEANDAVGAARDALSTTTSPSKRRAIFEEIEFWTNRLAYVTAARDEEASYDVPVR